MNNVNEIYKTGNNMQLKEITLLSEEEYEECKEYIPVVDNTWWLRTPGDLEGCMCCVFYYGCFCTYDNYVEDSAIGVRPLCIFNVEFANPAFWYKAGAKIKYGQYNWTVLGARDGELIVLCDDIIGVRRFDEQTNVWEESELKRWLETEGLKLIAA